MTFGVPRDNLFFQNLNFFFFFLVRTSFSFEVRTIASVVVYGTLSTVGWWMI